MSVPDVVKKVCDKNGWALQRHNVEIALPKGRHQIVRVEAFKHDGKDMIRLHTKVGDAGSLSTTRLRAALGLNSQVPFGALAILDDTLVMTDTFLLHDADSAEVEGSMRFIAETADRYERLIYTGDDN